MKNRQAVSGSVVYIFASSQYVTASLADAETLAGYRLRIMNGHCITTAYSPAYDLEVSHRMANILTNEPRNAKIRFRDGNLLNLTRENIGSGVVNEFWIAGDDTSFFVCGPHTIYVDTADVKLIQAHHWKVRSHKSQKGSLAVLADRLRHEHNQPKVIALPRFLMGLLRLDQRKVIHKNGDPFDMRRSNLKLFQPTRDQPTC